MKKSDVDKMFLDNYIGLMWREFNDIRKVHKVAPLILAFSIIDASAKLSVSDDKVSVRSRFIWWIQEFLDMAPYVPIDLYGARCGMLHEYGAESSLSRNGECRIISWTIGDRQHHGKSSEKMILISQEQFCDDMNKAGLNFVQRLKADNQMRQRVENRLPNIFGAGLI